MMIQFNDVLSDTHPAEGVQNVAAIICQRVANLNIPHGHSPTASHVTVSLGCISAACHQGASPEISPVRENELFVDRV